MEMKLLDLHTAEYFNDNTWYYGKDTILLKQIKVISACKYVAGTGVDPLLTRYEKPRFNGIEFLEMNKQPHTDPIINRLAEKVGAVIYGGRYVLVFEDNNGDIFCEKINFGTVYYISKNQYRFLPVKDFNQNNDIVGTVSRFFMLNKAPQYKIGNILEECSKQLRNQPNKFEELYYLIYGTK